MTGDRGSEANEEGDGSFCCFCILGVKLRDLVHDLRSEFFGTLSIQTRFRTRSLPQAGNGRRWSEATEQGEGVGGGYHTRELLHFLGFKLSDLVHTFR